jgi:hypothetical protein
MKLSTILSFLALGPALEACTTRSSPAGLVDLGYVKHIPTTTYVVVSGHNISVYKNIHCAKPPMGNLRFRLPDPGILAIPGIQNGTVADE